jgi:hypothetical protein
VVHPGATVTPRKSRPTAAPLERWRAASAYDRGVLLNMLSYTAENYEAYSAQHPLDVKRRTYGAALRSAVAVLQAAAQPRRRVVGWCVRGEFGYFNGQRNLWSGKQSEAQRLDMRSAKRCAETMGGRVVAIVERAR